MRIDTVQVHDILACRKYVAKSIRFQMLSQRLGPYSITVQYSM